MTVPRTPADLLTSTGYLLARVGSESRSRFVEALAGQELTLAGYSVVMLLGRASGRTQRELAGAVGIDPRNLVPVLDDLEAGGLVIREHHPVDRRRHAIRLTSEGRARLARLEDAGSAAERALLEPLSSAEQKQLHALLRKLLGPNS